MILDHTYYKVHLKDVDYIKTKDNSIGLFFRNILDMYEIVREIGANDDSIYISVETRVGYTMVIDDDGNIIKVPIIYTWENLPVAFIGWNPISYNDEDFSSWYDKRGFNYKGNIAKTFRKEKLEYLNTL